MTRMAPLFSIRYRGTTPCKSTQTSSTLQTISISMGVFDLPRQRPTCFTRFTLNTWDNSPFARNASHAVVIGASFNECWWITSQRSNCHDGCPWIELRSFEAYIAGADYNPVNNTTSRKSNEATNTSRWGLLHRFPYSMW